MRKLFPSVALLCLASLLVIGFNLSSDEESGQGDEGAVRAQVEGYVKAYNEHNVDKIASYWSKEGEMVDLTTGDTSEGKESILATLKENFDAGSTPQLNVSIGSIEFPHDGGAVVLAKAQMTYQDKSTEMSYYKVELGSEDGQWLIDRITELDIETPQEQKELKPLSWLIGEWISKDENLSTAFVFSWDQFKNFLMQTFTVSAFGETQLEGKQIVGWDPVKKAIHSWVFDSDGGFGEGHWVNNGKSWSVEMAQTLSDGAKASSVMTYTPIDENSFTFSITDRDLNGETLQDAEPITFTRSKK